MSQPSEEARKAWKKALLLLRIRPRSEEELRLALARADVTFGVIESTLERLRESGALDDRAYAEQFASERRRLKKHAPARIEKDLRSRGIPPDIARYAARKVYDEDAGDPEARLLDEGMTLLRNRQVHYTDLRPDVALRRMAGLLERAGYPGQIARDAVEAVIEEMMMEGLLDMPPEDV
ncbi:regulatory protein RecX [Candidatus Zixiibacteriota bacterium]